MIQHLHWNTDKVIYCGMMLALGWLAFFSFFDHHTSFGLYLGFGLGTLHFIRLYRKQSLSWWLLLPLLPVVSAALTTTVTWFQGGGDGDFNYAWMWLAVIVTGMAAGSLFPRAAWKPLMLIPVVISTSYIVCLLHGSIPNGARLELPFKGINQLALMAGFSPLIYLGNYREMNLKSRFLWIIPCCAIPIVILMQTGSRTPALGLAASIIGYLLFSCQKKRFLVTLLIAASIFLLFFTQSSNLWKNRSAPDRIKQSLLTRMAIYHVALEGFLDKPILGNQKSNFREYYESHIKENYNVFKNKYKRIAKIIAHPHNIYLGILFSWGLVGMVAFLLSSGSMLFAAHQEKYMFPVLAFIFFAFTGIFEFYIYRKDGLFIFFIVSGLAIGRHWGKHRKQTGQQEAGLP